MDDGPASVEGATETALCPERRRDAWLERRLGYLAGELARLKGNPPLRRFLRGAIAAYRPCLLTDDPAHRFQCWVILHAVSAGLDQLEPLGAGHKVPESAPGDPGPGPSLTAGLTDRPN
jgi:hypothetical protein